ncbi:ABC transporter substrate-binding protein [Pseudogemmobacter sonorensis]|uniref:ABC transporter substrate-binding protein n=1 Tax=Pseudogemmobacter sonorensis TaxID=2989681 RepID=UPI0036851745
MRLLSFLLALLPLPAWAEDILLSGPPIWESAPLIALAETQPVEGVTFIFRPWASPEELRKMLMAKVPLIAVAPSPTAAVFDAGRIGAGRIGADGIGAGRIGADGIGADGIGLRVVSATVTEGSLSIVGRGGPVADLAELRGASLALPFKGHLPDLMMRRIAPPGAESWQPYYTGSLNAGVQLLLAGQVDNALLTEPLATLALAQDPGLSRRAGLCGLWREATALASCPPAGVVLVNPAFGNRREVLSAYRAAFATLAADPGAAAPLLARHFPEMERAREGFARINALDLAMPENAALLADFYAAIMEVEPDAIGGRLPGPDFYGP